MDGRIYNNLSFIFSNRDKIGIGYRILL
jgi:hypothetical protein